jgi:hypothetical protein
MNNISCIIIAVVLFRCIILVEANSYDAINAKDSLMPKLK